MAVTTGKKIAEVYFEVKARTGKAAEELKKLHQAAEKDLKDSKERLQANKEFIKLKEKNVELTKKELAEAAKRIKADRNANRESLENLKKKVKEQEKIVKEREKAAKKQKLIEELMDSQIRRVWTNFSEWTGTQFDEQGRQRKRSLKQGEADYKSFLSRASREESRFANKLDQRDMTKSTVENIRRGMAKGLLIGEKWHKDENQLQRISRGLGIAGSSLDKIKSYAERATDGFYRLQRVGFTLQAALSVLGSTLGSLLGGLLSLVAVVGQALGAAVALGSAFASIGAGAIAAKIALGGVGKAVGALWDQQNGYNRALRDAKRALRDLRFEAEEAALSEEEAALNLERAREELARVQDLPPDSRARREAELQFQQAELAYRRAKARNKDARENLKRGPLYGKQDPLANLTESQKKFAKYLVSLKPKLQELKEAAASGFLPILQTSIENIVTNAFPLFKEGLNLLGTAMGNASKSLSDAFTTPENMSLLRDFFISSKPIIEIFGRAAGSALGGILAVLKAAEPITLKFAKWVEGTAKKFESWAKSGATTTLRDFFNLSGEVAAKLGAVFGKVFGGITNTMKAAFPSGVNSGAGGLLLSWLDKLATTFQKFTSSSNFGEWLKGSTDNALTALDTLGKFANIFVKLAAAPETKQFWLTIQTAIPYIEKMAADGIKAGPALAELVVQLVRMIALLSDSGTLETFLGALGRIVTMFNNFLEFIAPVLKFFGPLHGLILAATLAFALLRKGLMVIFGMLEKVTRAFGNFQAGMVRAYAETYTLTTRVKMLGASYEKLKGQTIALDGPFARLRAAINLTQRQAGTKKRMLMLEQMAKSAGATKAQITQLRRELTLASKQGATTLSQLTKQSAMAQKMNLAGAGSRFTAGRGAMARGGTAALGAASMVGSMAGGGGPVSSGLGMASMVASFLPGPLGLISGAVLGIGSAIAGGFEAQAQAEKEKKEKLKAAKLEAQIEEAKITVEKETKFGEETLKYMQEAGLSIKEAAAAVGREQQQASALATKYDVKAVYDEEGKLQQSSQQVVDSMRTALIDAGFGKEFAKDTNKSNLLLEAAVKLSKTTNVKDPQALADTVTQAVKTGGIQGLKNIIKEDTQLATDVNGNQVVTNKAGAFEMQQQRTNSAFAKAAIDPLTEQLGILKEALGNAEYLKGYGKDEKINTSGLSYTLTSKLTEANFDWTKVAGYVAPKPGERNTFGQSLKASDILAAINAQYGDTSNRLFNMQQQSKTGIAKDYKAEWTANNYAQMMLHQVVPKTVDPVANTAASTANSAAITANALAITANTLANTANSYLSKPTYIIINTDKAANTTTASNLLSTWVTTGGVTPVQFKGRRD